MTVREYLNSLSDEDFAEWLEWWCREVWENYEEDDVINFRYNHIWNFLKMEYEP